MSVFRSNSFNHHSLKSLVYEALFLALRINSEQNRQDHVLMESSSEDRQTVNRCERRNSNDKTQRVGALLYPVFKEGLSDMITMEPRPERSESVSHRGVRGRAFQGEEAGSEPSGIQRIKVE